MAKRLEFAEEEINKLAGRLIEYELDVLKPEEYRLTKKKDFEELQRINKVLDAITTILEYMEK